MLYCSSSALKYSAWSLGWYWLWVPNLAWSSVLPFMFAPCMGIGSGQVVSELGRVPPSWRGLPEPHAFCASTCCALYWVWFTCLGIGVLYLSWVFHLSLFPSSVSGPLCRPVQPPFGGFFGSAIMADE